MMTTHAIALDELNGILQTMSMRELNETELSTLLNQGNSKALHDAIRQSANNAGAKSFIRKQVSQLFTDCFKTQASNDASTDDDQSQLSSDACMPQEDDTTSGEPQSNRRYFNHTVYGKEFAMDFKACDDKEGVPSIYVDAARINKQRRCEWKNKIILKLTQRELPVVASVLLGYTQQCKFAHHGPQKDKAFEIKNQNGGVYIGLVQHNKPAHQVNIPPSDISYILPLFLKQLLALHPWMTDSGEMMLLRQLFRPVTAPVSMSSEPG